MEAPEQLTRMCAKTNFPEATFEGAFGEKFSPMVPVWYNGNLGFGFYSETRKLWCLAGAPAKAVNQELLTHWYK